MIEIKPPHKISYSHPKKHIFLGGSIEMGTAEDWQAKFVEEMKDFDVILFNPRRDGWDPSWEQSIDNPQFYEQVMWELQALEGADLRVFYFSSGTMSPITLLELGKFGDDDYGDTIVCCPQGYLRKGNVDIFCARYDVRICEDFDSLLKFVKSYLNGIF